MPNDHHCLCFQTTSSARLCTNRRVNCFRSRKEQRHVSEDGSLHNHHCENLRSYKENIGHMSTNSQVEDANPWPNFVWFLDYKLTFHKHNINITVFVGFEVCALGKPPISVLPGTRSLLIRNLPPSIPRQYLFPPKEVQFVTTQIHTSVDCDLRGLLTYGFPWSRSPYAVYTGRYGSSR
jgi:hypothetical protein